MVDYSRYFNEYHNVLYDPENILFRSHIIELINSVYNRDLNIIDLGCGVGILNYDIIREFGIASQNLTNLDISANSLEISRKFYKHVNIKGLKQICIPLEELYKINEKFDIALISEVLEHLDNDIDVLNMINNIVNDNGHLIVTVPFSQKEPNLYERKVWGHVRNYTEKSLVGKLQQTGFRIITLKYFGRYTKFLWGYPKLIIYLLWLIYEGLLVKRLRGKYVPSFYNTGFHKNVVLPIFKKILEIDKKTDTSRSGKVFKYKHLVVLAQKVKMT